MDVPGETVELRPKLEVGDAFRLQPFGKLVNEGGQSMARMFKIALLAAVLGLQRVLMGRNASISVDVELSAGPVHRPPRFVELLGHSSLLVDSLPLEHHCLESDGHVRRHSHLLVELGDVGLHLRVILLPVPEKALALVQPSGDKRVSVKDFLLKIIARVR